MRNWAKIAHFLAFIGRWGCLCCAMAWPMRHLLQWSHAHIYAFGGESGYHRLQVGVAVVVGDVLSWLVFVCILYALLGGHGVGLIYGQECHIHLAEIAHFVDWFGVAGNVDAEVVDA